MRIQDQNDRSRLILTAVGALQGLVIWILFEMEGPALTTATLSALLTFVLISGAVFHFAWTGQRALRLGIVAIVIGIVYAAITYWVAVQVPDYSGASAGPRGDQTRITTWIVATLFSLYVLGPFLQIYQATGSLRFAYDKLFVRSWSNFHIALVGVLFVLTLWAVLGLWAALFGLLNIDFFADLFTEALFIALVTGGAIGFGLSLGREREALIATLRKITLSVFASLLPLICAVAILFVAAIPFAGLDTLWDTRRASWILLAWLAYTVLFLNAAYEDGQAPAPRGATVRWIIQGGLLTMLVFCALAAYGLYLRIDQYGLTPARLWGSVCALVASLYIVGYSASLVISRNRWLSTVQKVNVWMAPVLVGISLLLHTALLDPLRLSAASQYARLVDGRTDADTFDYEFLRFKLGQAGQRRLNALRNLETHAEYSAIVAGIDAAEQAKFYRRRPGQSVDTGRVNLYPTGTEWPEGLLATIRNDSRSIAFAGSAGEVAVIAIELDGAPGDEYLVLPALSLFESYAFRRRDDGTWEKFGTFRLDGPHDASTLQEDLAAGRWETATPEFPDIIIGERRFRYSR